PALWVLVASRTGLVEELVGALGGAGAGAANRNTNGAASVGVAVNPPLHAEEEFFAILAAEDSRSFSQYRRARSASMLARWPELPATKASSLNPREPIRFPTITGAMRLRGPVVVFAIFIFHSKRKFGTSALLNFWSVFSQPVRCASP